MSQVQTALDKWALAGKKDWEQGLKKITKMSFAKKKATPKGKTSPMQDYLIALQKVIVSNSEYGAFIQTGLKGKNYTFKQLVKLQDSLNQDINPNSKDAGYSRSFANPAYACKCFNTELGHLLCLIYSRFRNYLQLIIQKRYTDLAKLNKLYMDLCELAQSYDTTGKDYSAWQKLLKKYILSDLEEVQLFNMYWRFSPEQDYYKNIILKADLSDPNYLFRFGIYVSKDILETAKFINQYPEKELKKLSQYIIKSYLDGFERGNRSHKIKKYANLMIPAGMERLGKLLIQDLRKIGLEAVIPQPLAQSYNKQYDYDHRFSMAVFYDKDYSARYLTAYEKAVKKISECLKLQAGPVYVELFGEMPFSPAESPAAFRLRDEQKQILQETSGKTTQIFYKHYIRTETSFCIIAFPSPEIGPQFRKIFADTVKLNMLDSMLYAGIQQKIIDVLDTAEFVHIKGKKGNGTDIMVKLHILKDPQKETNFENCVADVNIPVGEVFTSPLLKGTNGVLHVKDIYLRNLRFHNLKLTFKDGYIRDYACTNFKDTKTNRKYIEENLLMPHKTLPIGEFAIGTNTTAYYMALKYDILALLPILIIEKMGPHFAVGDTCYSREEDFDHFNFVNGKKIVAVENEKSALRKKDPLNAYTQVHTDITLPYNMLKSITAVRKDGSKTDIIKDGFFVVPGTEKLNLPLLKLKSQKK